MPKIAALSALEILDSRGNPTLQVTVRTDEDTNKCLIASASVPSGASTGKFEALELRDKDPSRYQGKGVRKAIENVLGPLAKAVIGQEVSHQKEIDHLLIEADGTKDKSKLGANAILGVSLAVARAAALAVNLPLYRYLGGAAADLLPCPMINIINGGVHADNSLDAQEFLIRPTGAPSFAEAIRWGSEIFYTLKKLLKENGYVTSVGDEGGFSPNLSSTESALDIIVQAIEQAGYQPGNQVSLAMDMAATEFFDANLKKYIEKKKKAAGLPYIERTGQEQTDYLESLCAKYPIDSIEDGLAENDWEGWRIFTERMGKKIQIIGDDIFVTNMEFLKKGIEQGVGNSILIKLNQIGTLTETLECVRMAHSHGFTTVISHRSGETEDSFIADLAVATKAGQIKTGSMCRSERICKYNRLLAIEAELGGAARFTDSNPFRKR